MTRTEGDRTVVEVGGEIDVYTAPAAARAARRAGGRRQVPPRGRPGAASTSSTRPASACSSAALKRVRAHDGSLRLVLHPGAHPQDLPDHRARPRSSRSTRRSPRRSPPPSELPAPAPSRREVTRGHGRARASPPCPAHVRTARLVAVAVARRAGVDEDVLDEVRLAVGEACSRAVAPAPPALPGPTRCWSTLVRRRRRLPRSRSIDRGAGRGSASASRPRRRSTDAGRRRALDDEAAARRRRPGRASPGWSTTSRSSRGRDAGVVGPDGLARRRLRSPGVLTAGVRPACRGPR